MRVKRSKNMKNICFIKTIMNGMKRFRSKNAQR